MKYLVIYCLLLISSILQAQEKNYTISELSFYADAMTNLYIDNHRIQASNYFDEVLNWYVDKEVYLEDDFQALKGFANDIKSEDGKVRIISWQIKESEDKYKYGAYAIIEDNAPIKLTQTSSISLDQKYSILSLEEWYGAIYYNIKDYTTQEGEKVYFIFGFNGYDKYDSFKVLDVLSIEEGNSISFGKPIFIKDDSKPIPDVYSRILLQYSNEVSASINYNPAQNLIIYDHLISRLGQLEGQGVTMVPDGSYEGFILENGKLIYKEKLYDHVYEKAPIDGKRENSKDLFGKSKKK